jgi:hypothetical protein
VILMVYGEARRELNAGQSNAREEEEGEQHEEP